MGRVLRPSVLLPTGSIDNAGAHPGRPFCHTTNCSEYAPQVHFCPARAITDPQKEAQSRPSFCTTASSGRAKYCRPLGTWSARSSRHFRRVCQPWAQEIFLKDATYRESQQKLGWTGAKRKEIDDLAQEDHTYKATKEELDRYRSHWTLPLDDSTFNEPMLLRDDYKAAVSLKHHLYRLSEDYQKPIPPQYRDRQRRGCKFSETYRQGPNIDPKTGGHFGQVRRVLHPGGRVPNGMNGMTTTHKTW